MRCALSGAGVVVDQTALITLHRLGLLDRCADYFGQVLFPVGYLALLLEDSDALVSHQPSWMKSLEEIRQAIDLRRIVVVDNEAGLPRVDEYDQPGDAPGSTPPYRLRDVVDLLAEDGKITDEQEAEGRKLFHELPRATRHYRRPARGADSPVQPHHVAQPRGCRPPRRLAQNAQSASRQRRPNPAQRGNSRR